MKFKKLKVKIEGKYTNTEIEKNKEITIRFIQVFNNDDWDSVR